MTSDYVEVAHATIDTLTSTQASAIEATVSLIATRLSEGGVLHAFGTGRDVVPVIELAREAEGLMPVHLVQLGDLALHAACDPSELAETELERDKELAGPLFAMAAPETRDVLLIVSTQGVAELVVEFAARARQAGLPVIALTSVAYSRATPTRHPSGMRLLDVADVVVDSGAPVTDSILDLGRGGRVGAVASLAGVLAVQLVTEGTAKALHERGQPPPEETSRRSPRSSTATSSQVRPDSAGASSCTVWRPELPAFHRGRLVVVEESQPNLNDRSD